MEVMDFLKGAECKYQLILTKSDAVSKSQLRQVAEATLDAIAGRNCDLCSDTLYAVSGKAGLGLDEVRSSILHAAAEDYFEAPDSGEL